MQCGSKKEVKRRTNPYITKQARIFLSHSFFLLFFFIPRDGRFRCASLQPGSKCEPAQAVPFSCQPRVGVEKPGTLLVAGDG